MGTPVTPSSQLVNSEHEFMFRQRVFNLFNAVNGNLNLNNLNGVLVANVSAPGAANTEFSITHNLGRVPIFYWFISKLGGNLYERNGDGTAWTAKVIFVKSTTASDIYNVYII